MRVVRKYLIPDGVSEFTVQMPLSSIALGIVSEGVNFYVAVLVSITPLHDSPQDFVVVEEDEPNQNLAAKDYVAAFRRKAKSYHLFMLNKSERVL